MDLIKIVMIVYEPSALFKEFILELLGDSICLSFFVALKACTCDENNIVSVKKDAGIPYVFILGNKPFGKNKWLLADGCIYNQTKGNATLPSLTISKLPLPLDYVPLASTTMRFSYNSIGVAGTTNVYSSFVQCIEEGVKLLGSVSKKIIISFYARSSIPNKKIGIDFRMCFGTGGTPSSQTDIPGGLITLTSYFKKYSVSITLPDLIYLSFGTNNDSYLRASICQYWTEDYSARIGAFTSMVLNSTDFKLPYMPKTIAEELRDCQRYYAN